MASFTGSKYDVFISYRQADNKFGWVTSLDKTLRSLLEEHARPDKQQPPWTYEVFRDNREIDGNVVLGDALKDAVSSSAVLVIVMSENYLAEDSDWCAKELAMFQAAVSRSPHRDGRIFVVLRGDIPVPERPANLRQFIGYQFWELDEQSGLRQPISFDFSRAGRVPVSCQKLGDDIFETLQGMRNGHAPDAAADFHPLPDAAPIVFLTEVTDDLYVDRAGVDSFLTQAGIRVVPGKNQQYRFSPEPAEAEIPPLLTSATLVVQMHGSIPIPSDEAYAGGLDAWLFAQAKEAGKEPGKTLLRWRRPKVKQTDFTVEEYARFVFEGDVIAQDLEQFKQFVVQRVRELTQRQKVDVGVQGAKVLIIAKDDGQHRSIVDDFTDRIDELNSIEAARVLENLPLQAVAKEFDARRSTPRGLVVVHADNDEVWVQGRMQECRRYQLSKKPRMPLCAVVVRPAENQPRTVPGRFEVILDDDEAAKQAFLARLAAEVAP
jgi:TIR domain